MRKLIRLQDEMRPSPTGGEGAEDDEEDADGTAESVLIAFTDGRS